MITETREVAVLEQPQVEQRVLRPEGPEDERAPSAPARSTPGTSTLGDAMRALARDRRDAVEEQRQARRHQRHADEVEGLRRLRVVLRQRDARRRSRATTPIGTLIRKIQCQLATCDQPAAEDRARRSGRAASARRGSPSAGPSGAGPAARVMIVMPSGISMPPPRPCRTRKPISIVESTSPSRTARSRAVNSAIASHVEALGAEPVGGPAGQRDDRGEGERVAGDGPGDGGVRQRRVGSSPKTVWKRRQRDVDDGDVEDRHDRARGRRRRRP